MELSEFLTGGLTELSTVWALLAFATVSSIVRIAPVVEHLGVFRELSVAETPPTGRSARRIRLATRARQHSMIMIVATGGLWLIHELTMLDAALETAGLSGRVSGLFAGMRKLVSSLAMITFDLSIAFTLMSLSAGLAACAAAKPTPSAYIGAGLAGLGSVLAAALAVLDLTSGLGATWVWLLCVVGMMTVVPAAVLLLVKVVSGSGRRARARILVSGAVFYAVLGQLGAVAVASLVLEPGATDNGAWISVAMLIWVELTLAAVGLLAAAARVHEGGRLREHLDGWAWTAPIAVVVIVICVLTPPDVTTEQLTIALILTGFIALGTAGCALGSRRRGPELFGPDRD